MWTFLLLLFLTVQISWKLRTYRNEAWYFYSNYLSSLLCDIGWFLQLLDVLPFVPSHHAVLSILSSNPLLWIISCIFWLDTFILSENSRRLSRTTIELSLLKRRMSLFSVRISVYLASTSITFPVYLDKPPVASKIPVCMSVYLASTSINTSLSSRETSCGVGKSGLISFNIGLTWSVSNSLNIHHASVNCYAEVIVGSDWLCWRYTIAISFHRRCVMLATWHRARCRSAINRDEDL